MTALKVCSVETQQVIGRYSDDPTAIADFGCEMMTGCWS